MRVRAGQGRTSLTVQKIAQYFCSLNGQRQHAVEPGGNWRSWRKKRWKMCLQQARRENHPRLGWLFRVQGLCSTIASHVTNSELKTEKTLLLANAEVLGSKADTTLTRLYYSQQKHFMLSSSLGKWPLLIYTLSTMRAALCFVNFQLN